MARGRTRPRPGFPRNRSRRSAKRRSQPSAALNLKGYARIDMFVREDGRVAVLEPNTLPGMTPSTVLFHQAAASGITQADLIDRIIQYPPWRFTPAREALSDRPLTGNIPAARIAGGDDCPKGCFRCREVSPRPPLTVRRESARRKNSG